MANRTDKEAYSIHGTNPQNLVEYIIRQKVYQTTYWKESCFALTAETVVERAAELRAAGGTYGGARKPTNFMCLILKMLQIQPDKEIIIEYIKSGDFKYVRLLGAFYMRLVGRPQEVYQYLEPLYNDYRKVRVMTLEGQYVLRHMDEVVDDMLNKDHMFDIALPRLPARWALEKAGTLEPRVSVLDEEFDEGAVQREAEAEAARQREAQREYADMADGVGPAGGRERHRDAEEDRDGHEAGNGHRRSYDEDRRKDSPERRKEKWQLSKDERREQARRRSPSRSRSPVRSTSRSPVRGGGRDERDRRERDEGPSHRQDERDRDRRRGDEETRDRRRDDRERRDDPRDERRREDREDARDRRRDDVDRDKGRERRRSRSRSRDRGRDRDKRRSRSRSVERKADRGRDKPSTKVTAAGAAGAGGAGGKRAADPSDPEVAEANAVRASLGLPPLK